MIFDHLCQIPSSCSEAASTDETKAGSIENTLIPVCLCVLEEDIQLPQQRDKLNEWKINYSFVSRCIPDKAYLRVNKAA